MTQQAAVVPLRPRCARRLLIERIEDDALLRIDGGELQRVGAANPPDRNGVAEIHRARIAGRDLRALGAALREHERLRSDRYLERIENRAQIAGLAVEGETDRPV